MATKAQVIAEYQSKLGRSPGPDDWAAIGHPGTGAAWESPNASLDWIAQSPEAAAYPTRKLIRDWYSVRPATPATYKYSSEQEAADTAAAREQDRPMYQRLSSESGSDFTNALASAREGFSRRGLWGSSAEVAQTVDPTTGITNTNLGTNAPVGGPQSGLRQAGEQRMGELQGRQNTAYGRAYETAVAADVLGRDAKSQNIYDTTIWNPYQDQLKAWESRLAGLQAGLK